jgi:hypothetical protein
LVAAWHFMPCCSEKRRRDVCTVGTKWQTDGLSSSLVLEKHVSACSILPICYVGIANPWFVTWR